LNFQRLRTADFRIEKETASERDAEEAKLEMNRQGWGEQKNYFNSNGHGGSVAFSQTDGS